MTQAWEGKVPRNINLLELKWPKFVFKFYNEFVLLHLYNTPAPAAAWVNLIWIKSFKFCDRENFSISQKDLCFISILQLTSNIPLSFTQWNDNKNIIYRPFSWFWFFDRVDNCALCSCKTVTDDDFISLTTPDHNVIKAEFFLVIKIELWRFYTHFTSLQAVRRQ